MDRLLVTGGSGSLGMEILRQFKGYKVGLTNDEYQLVEAAQELDIPWVLCDVRNKESLRGVVRTHKINRIIHAAALKHVPICEANPEEAILTNINGSRNIIEVAKEFKIYKVLAVSSDKAYHPVNTYGATKLIMERMFLNAGFSVVRFPNFWASRGSVIQLWEKQAIFDGVITITDPDATRYFIDLKEAAKICLTNVETMWGLVKVNGEKIKLSDLADKIAPKASWKITGLRDGEKKHEELE